VDLSLEQVLALAPDASAAAAGKKLGTPGPWQGVARSARALWGECQGSALYRVQVELGSLTGKCSCPSRKFPCKHVLGLLLLAVSHPPAQSAAAEPDWVTEWLGKRAATAEKKAAPKSEAPVDEAAQQKRALQRGARVEQGLAALELWMRDLVRNGLAGLEAQPPAFWATQAARLVDAQAGSLASRVGALGELVGTDPSWPSRLLDALGRIALLLQAQRRGEALPPALFSEVRQRIGWAQPKEDVLAKGARASDRFIVAGQTQSDDGRVRSQRTWLLGVRTGATPLVLQFGVGSAPFPELFVPGTAFEGEVSYFAGPLAQRALVVTRESTSAWTEPLPGHASMEAMLDHVAAQAAQQPFLERTAVALEQVIPVDGGAGAQAFVLDRSGAALPLERTALALLLARSGGAPVDLFAEWDGRVLRPLSFFAGGALRAIARPQ
jgi:hypothetical protein